MVWVLTDPVAPLACTTLAPTLFEMTTRTAVTPSAAGIQLHIWSAFISSQSHSVKPLLNWRVQHIFRSADTLCNNTWEQCAHYIRSQMGEEQHMFECRFCFGKALSHFLADLVAVELVEVVNPALWSCFNLCLWGISAGWHCFAISFTRQIPRFKSTYDHHFLPYCLLFVYYFIWFYLVFLLCLRFG